MKTKSDFDYTLNYNVASVLYGHKQSGDYGTIFGTNKTNKIL